jgi:tetratricopeptide (TPR) repeat protein
MERKIYLIILLFCSPLVMAQSAPAGEVIYRAFVRGDMALWKRTVERLHQEPRKSNVQMLELVNYLYGYTGWAISEGRTREVRHYLGVTEAYLDTLETRRFRLAEVHAYRSAMLGFRISLSPLSAPVLGPRSLRYANRSVEINPLGYHGYVQLGHIAFYSPPAFGGSKSEAIRHYLNALQRIAPQGAAGVSDWNYLSLLVTIGQAYEKTGQRETARQYYRRILDIAPDFVWVRDVLMPGLDNR